VKALFITALLCAPAAAAPPEVEKELAVAVHKLYDLEWDAAESACAEFGRKHPGHPGAPFYAAVTAYQRWIAEGMSSTAAYASASARLEETIAAAEKALPKDPALGHYYLGAAKGFQARAYAGKGRYMKAVPAASSAVRHLNKALELDPALDDAALGLGMYHYFGARMPSGARPFASLLAGEAPDKDKGLALLRRVAVSSGTAREEARSVLAMVLSREGPEGWPEAETLLAELTQRHPKNPLFRLRRAWLAAKRGDYERSVALYDAEGRWPDAHPDPVRSRARAWALYRAAEVRVLQSKGEEAERLLRKLDGLALPKGMKDWALLRAGNAADLRGDRDAAARLYKAVDEKRARELAKKFLKEPWPAGPKELMPFFTGY
jgi:tetratricopeptide (TPR) repeat protein